MLSLDVAFSNLEKNLIVYSSRSSKFKLGLKKQKNQLTFQIKKKLWVNC